MTKLSNMIIASLLLALGALVASESAAAQNAPILFVDEVRVEAEAAAYTDFNLQTKQITDGIRQLRQYVIRNGVAERELSKLEEQKSLIGADEYEKQRKVIAERYQGAQQQLQVFEFEYERLREEAMTQIQRARQPVIRELLKARKAQVILPKRVALGTAAGIDITTEYIERLNEQLPTVTLSLRTQPAEGAATEEGGDAENKIEDID